MTDEEKEGLSLAFNEATLLGAEIDAERRMAAITLSVLTLPEPEDTRIQVLLLGVGRAAGLLRVEQRVVPFAPEELLSVVQDFGGGAVYGDQFFDVDEVPAQVSFDVSYADSHGRHWLRLFQEGSERNLDFWIWFDELVIRDPQGNELAIEDVAEAAKRWWKAFREHDPRTLNRGLIPLS